MKLYTALTLILILISCAQPIETNVSDSAIIKKERIIRYKLLSNDSQLAPPFSENKNKEDTFYQYFSSDSTSMKLPIINQHQGYKVIEKNLTGGTIKEFTYDKFVKLTETKITITNDSILFSRSITPSTKVEFTTLTLTSNKIKKELTKYYNPSYKSMVHCGTHDDSMWEIISILDSNNNPIKIKSDFGTQTFNYNSNGQVVYYQNINNSTGEKYCSATSIYNANNLLIQENCESDDPYFVSTTAYEYKNDTLVQTSHYDADNNLKWTKSTKYEYDNRGNWTKKIESINSIPRFITQREITYY